MTLRTLEYLAERWGCSTKTVIGHTRDGTLRCVNVGRGKKKARRRFTDDDIADFESRAQREVPCQSTSTKTARSRHRAEHAGGGRYI